MSVKNYVDWPTPGDPLTAFYMGVANALLSNTYLTGGSSPLLKLGNLNVWCDGVQQTLMQAIQTGNTPEITLIQSLHSIHPFGHTSEVSEFRQTVSLACVTDTLQISQINAIKYGVTAAMLNSNPESWQFNGKNYVGDFDFRDGGDGSAGITLPAVVGGDATRGVNRMGTIIPMFAVLYVAKTDMPT